MSALRRETNHTAANGSGSPFQHGGNSRNCFRCGKWRPQAGGGKCARTGQWICACCKPPNIRA